MSKIKDWRTDSFGLRYGKGTFWWEEFIEIDFAFRSKEEDDRLILILRETQECVGRANNLMDANEMAIIALNKIFEETVLGNSK